MSNLSGVNLDKQDQNKEDFLQNLNNSDKNSDKILINDLIFSPDIKKSKISEMLQTPKESNKNI